MKSIRNHVDPEDKRKLSELGSKTKKNETDPLKSKQNELFWLKTDNLKEMRVTLFISMSLVIQPDTSLPFRIRSCIQVMGNQGCITIY